MDTQILRYLDTSIHRYIDTDMDILEILVSGHGHCTAVAEW